MAGKFRCIVRDQRDRQCVLAKEHFGKTPCRFKVDVAQVTFHADADAPEQTTAALHEMARLVLTNQRRMNKTETRYANMLEARRLVGEIQSFEYEAIKLRLAAKCFLTPDFFVINAAGAVEIHEVKGRHIWEDARVKIKVAAAKFKCWKFYLAQYKAGNWTVDEVRA